MANEQTPTVAAYARMGTEAQLTCTPARRGFGALRCPLCGAEGTISLDLDDATADEAMRCNQCDNTFGVEVIRETIAAWTRVLAWIDAAPEMPA